MSWYVQKAKWSPRSVAEYYFPEYFPEYFAEWINILSAPTLLKTRMDDRAKLRTAFVENAYGRRVSIETRMSISVCFFFIPLGVLLVSGVLHDRDYPYAFSVKFCTPGPEFCYFCSRVRVLLRNHTSQGRPSQNPDEIWVVPRDAPRRARPNRHRPGRNTHTAILFLVFPQS